MISQRYKKLQDNTVKLYANKLDKLEEMYKLLETYHLPRLSQEKTGNPNRSSLEVTQICNKNEKLCKV